MIDRSLGDVILIVDDVPDNLSVLHDALDECGYTVLVATDGEQALQRAAQARPDLILLDAVMPGLDGFEVARRLKSGAVTAPIPIVFMTGLTETDHVVAAFEAGGIDYVTKPIRAREVIARIAAHLQAARERRHSRQALDAFGHATLSVRSADGRVLWQTPLARELLRGWALLAPPPASAAEGGPSPAPVLGEPLRDWLQAQTVRVVTGNESQPLTLARPTRRLSCVLQAATGDDEWLLVLQEQSDQATLELLAQGFGLTAREAEVLHWVVQGKTNRDIGDILALSPRTVHKHLEHVFAKLGVETRTAAAGRALKLVAGGRPRGGPDRAPD